jgi:ankyrin repeat protein
MPDYSLILEFLKWNPNHNKDYITFIKENNTLNDKIIDYLSKELVHLCMNSKEGNLKYINAFLDNGVNVDYVNICTPLTVICWKGGNDNIAEELIIRGANVNCIAFNSYTPLMFAASRKALTLVKILLNYGADANIENNAGEKAINLIDKNTCYENEKEKQMILDMKELLLAFTNMN